MYAHTRIHSCIHTHTHTHIHSLAHTLTHTHVHTRTHAYERTSVYMYILYCMHIHKTRAVNLGNVYRYYKNCSFIKNTDINERFYLLFVSIFVITFLFFYFFVFFYSYATFLPLFAANIFHIV